MKYTILLITLLASTICIGQSGSASGQAFNSGLISTNNRYGSIHNKGFISYEEVMKEYENIDGSPYLYGQEIIVDFISQADSLVKNVPILYDLYNNEIIAKKKDGSTIVLDQKYYKGFIYKNEGREETYLRAKADDLTFYHILFRTQDFVFYKTNKVRLEKDDRRVPGVETPTQKFVQKAKYFILQNGKTQPVKLRNGEAMSYFPKKYSAQIIRLKKKFKIKKIRKEKDYIKIINALQAFE